MYKIIKKLLRGEQIDGPEKILLSSFLRKEFGKWGAFDDIVKDSIEHVLSLSSKPYFSYQFVRRIIFEELPMEISTFLREDVAFIVANGPSLNKTNLNLVRMFPYVLMNRGYLKKELSEDSFSDPFMYVAVNDLVIRQFREEIMRFTRLHRNMLVALPDGINIGVNRIGLKFDRDIPKFSNPFESLIWQGHTVTYVALQLLFYLGFKNVIIVGLDHHYPNALGKPTNYEELFLEDDKSHFSKDYFKGYRWHTPNLRRSEIAYELALNKFKNAGGMIYNATPKSKLTIFPKVDIETALYELSLTWRET